MPYFYCDECDYEGELAILDPIIDDLICPDCGGEAYPMEEDDFLLPPSSYTTLRR